MDVLINGVQYIVASAKPKLSTNKDTLDILFYSRDLDRTLSVRDYLKELLLTLWDEQESFSGKRPFGNSDWYWELYEVLVSNNIVAGTLDEDGFVEEMDKAKGHDYIMDLIKCLN